MLRLKYIIIICMALLPQILLAQTKEIEEQQDSETIAIKVKMLSFKSELSDLYERAMVFLDFDAQAKMKNPQQNLYEDRMKRLKTALQSFNSRWTTYTQAQQVYIADNDSLLNWVGEIQLIQQALSDSLDSKKLQYDQLVGFNKAEDFLFSQDSIYKEMYKEAVSLSLVSKLAPRLEALKAKEQLKFADIQSNYDKAKEAVVVFPGLSKRMEKIDARYIQLKSMSGKIQEMAFKPFIQRVKDYLMGFAAVAILLMFANLAVSRLKSIKQARDQAKKLRDTLQGKQDYPTI